MIRSSIQLICKVRSNHLVRSSLLTSSRTFANDTTDHHHPGHNVNNVCSVCSGTKIDAEPYTEPWIPSYPKKTSESIEVKRSRLLYQSRKRGMLENDLLLATFASKYLSTLEPKLLQQYDSLINGESNDWEIFYWIVGQKPTPEEYENELMKLLRTHAANLNKESRICQPDI